jgi:tetratricopeptide (TPR) repeat protein
VVSLDEGNYAQSSAYLEQTLGIARETGARGIESGALRIQGLTCFHLGDYAAARAYCEEALCILRETGWSETPVVLALGWIAHRLGDNQTAREYGRQALHFAESHRTGRQALASMLLGQALAGLGQLTDAADAYRQALALQREMGQRHLIPEPLAGLARVALAQGDHTQALAHVGEILDHLGDHPGLGGTIEPLRVYLTCYQVLRAHDDPRAEEVLDVGYQLLQERADKIGDEDLRRSYLENVPYHRQIVEAWKEASG